MRGQAVSVTGLEILPYEHFSPLTGKKVGCILAVQMVSSCKYFPHHKHPI